MKRQFSYNTATSRRVLGIPALAVLGLAQAHAVTILNGDFESGHTGFTSDYAYVAPGPGALLPAGVYTVDTNPRNSHGGFYDMGDHTTGSGQMMIINGSTTVGISVWEGESTVSLVVGEKYDFSAWVASVNPTSPAVLTFKVGTEDIGTLSPESDGTWKRLFGTFTATEADPTFQLLNANPAASGNDFAIDDISIFFAGTTTPPTDPPNGVPETGTAFMGLLTLLGMCGFNAYRRRAERANR